MIIKLEIPPEMEAKLREDGRKHGLASVRRLLAEAMTPVVDAAVQTLTQDLPDGVIQGADQLSDAEFEALIDELVVIAPSLPSLPDSAISREAIYDDHP